MANTGRRTDSIARRCALGALALILWLALSSTTPSVWAQVDSSAARQARAALAEVRRTYSGYEKWSQWSRELGLEDVAHELRSGDRADPQIFAAAVAELASPQVGQFREAAFRRLSAALSARAAELEPVDAARWPSACREAAANFTAIKQNAVDGERRRLAARLRDLERRMPDLRRNGSAWHKFLMWPVAQSLVTSSPTDAAELDRLEKRWQNAVAVWAGSEMVEASLAVRSTARLLRGYITSERREEHAAAWNELADILESTNPPQGPAAVRVGELLSGREQLGQASPLTASIRRALSQPNVNLRVRSSWLAREFSQPINEPYRLNETIAGARTVSNGRLAGAAKCVVWPSRASGQLALDVAATSTARSTGYADRVQVASRATTRINGEKRLIFEESGVVTRPATARARTAIVYDRIDAEGLRPRRVEAERQTRARRPRAEAESAALAERSLRERLDTEGAQLAANFNKNYWKNVRDPLIRADRLLPEMRTLSDQDRIQWSSVWTDAEHFALTQPAPVLDSAADVVFEIAGTALEEEARITLSDRRLSGEELTEAVAKLLGGEQTADSGPQDYTIEFDHEPCEVKLDAGVMHVQLKIASFEAGDAEYPAIVVGVDYQVEKRDQGLALVRQGNLRVKSAAADAGQRSGRQQTLRLAVQRRLGKVLTEELVWKKISLPVAAGTTLSVDQVRADGDWLQLALVPERKP